MTLAIANGFAISMSPEAAASWSASREGDGQPARKAPIEAAHLPLFLKQFPGAFKINRPAQN